MTTETIQLSQIESDALDALARSSGKSRETLLREGLELLLARPKPADWKEKLRSIEGIWRDRDDLPDFRKIREEFDRF